MKIDPSNFIFTNACEPPKTIRSTRFDDETIAALRTRLTDYLAARGVELHRKGTRLAGLCPVHEDRTPSFHVFGTDHQTCGCYPCGFTGDVFAVSQWIGRSSNFPEAVHDVAGTLGVHLPQSTRGHVSRPATAQPRPAKQPAPQSNPLRHSFYPMPTARKSMPQDWRFPMRSTAAIPSLTASPQALDSTAKPCGWHHGEAQDLAWKKGGFVTHTPRA